MLFSSHTISGKRLSVILIYTLLRRVFAYGIGRHFNIREQTVWYDSCPGGVGMLVFGDDPFYYFLQLFYLIGFRDDISETVLFVVAHNGIARIAA
jgi:hypothetical protein